MAYSFYSLTKKFLFFWSNMKPAASSFPSFSPNPSLLINSPPLLLLLLLPHMRPNSLSPSQTLKRRMRMSCNGCRVLRKGCGEDCTIRPCLQWIKSPESQAHATMFLAKFYGRAGLINLINAGPNHQRPGIQILLLWKEEEMIQVWVIVWREWEDAFGKCVRVCRCLRVSESVSFLDSRVQVVAVWGLRPDRQPDLWLGGAALVG